MSFQEILEMIIRRRVLFLVSAVVVFLFSCAALFFMPKQYEAHSLIRVKNEQLIDPLVKDIAVSPDMGEQINTLSRQVTAWPELEQLVSQLELVKDGATSLERDDYIRSLQKRIVVRSRSKEIVEISYQDEDPQRAHRIANTLTANFLEETQRSQRDEAGSAIDFISGQLAIYREKLESSQQNFMSSKIENDLRLALNRRNLLIDRMGNIQRLIPSQITTEQNPVVAQLRSRVGELEAELTRLTLDAREGNPWVEKLRGEIDTIKKRIGQEMEATTVKESISSYNPAYLQAEQELKQTDMEIDFLQKQKQELEERAGGEPRQTSEEELGNLERAKEVDEDIYQMLLRQLESAYVSERLQDSEKGSRFSIMEYARLPMRPSKPNIPAVIGMGFFGGIAFGFCLVLATENLLRSFPNASQAKSVLEMTHLGSISLMVPEHKGPDNLFSYIACGLKRHLFSNETIAKMKFVSPHVARAKNDPRIAPQVAMFHDPQSRIADEYRVFRTHVFDAGGLPGPVRTVLITSTLRGEGKSTTSSNLALAAADSGKNTVLVDCDMRKGTLNTLFSLKQGPGVMEVLTGKAPLEDALQSSGIEGLSLIPCGGKTPKPAEVIAHGGMSGLLEALHKKFDVVVIDSPPVLNMPDAPLLSKYADAVILVVQTGKTRITDVLGAKERLQHVHAPLLGFVMTNVQYYMPNYMYEYYYRSYEN